MEFTLSGETVKSCGLDDTLRYPQLERINVRSVGRGKQWVFSGERGTIKALKNELKERWKQPPGGYDSGNRQACKRDYEKLTKLLGKDGNQ